MTIAAIYCRVSTTDQKDNGTSLETQKEAALAKCRRSAIMGHFQGDKNMREIGCLDSWCRV